MSSISSLSSGLGSYQPDFTRLTQRLFSKADTDGDGKVSQDELLTLMKSNPKLAQDLTNYYNASGATGSTTATDNVAAVFQALDTDGDGAISVSELAAAVSNTKGGRIDGPPPPPPSPEELLAQADTDGDGTTTASEFSALLDNDPRLASALASLLDTSSKTDGATATATSADTGDAAATTSTSDATAIFQAIDTDGDGAISASELTAAFSKVRDQLKAGPPPPDDPAAGADSTTGPSDGTSGTSARLEALLAQLLQRARSQDTYGADGSADSSRASGIFRATA